MDSSVVVKVLWEESGSALAEQLFERGSQGFAAPRLLAYEVANALRFARQGFSPRHRQELLDIFLQMRIALHDPDHDALREALTLADDKRITAYDAAYVVLARRLGTRLVTADTKLLRRMGDSRVVHLEDDLPDA